MPRTVDAQGLSGARSGSRLPRFVGEVPQIRADNVEAIAFYESIGFTADDVINMGKRLEEDCYIKGRGRGVATHAARHRGLR